MAEGVFVQQFITRGKITQKYSVLSGINNE